MKSLIVTQKIILLSLNYFTLFTCTVSLLSTFSILYSIVDIITLPYEANYSYQ
jgi:hypothetical protein